ncbi:unnamed protein product [Urochloa decumbens]|uniref:Uncharacterized protein n=1 Tax=Urochloa decumbens TaxID=240449 RepID=A0ABC9GTA8_9POAL
MESGELPLRPEPSVGSKPGRHGGWRAAFFLIAVVFFECIGFYGVEGNLIMYLTGPLGMSTAVAAAAVNAWSGTVLVLPLAGTLAANSHIGRYGAVMTASVLLSVGQYPLADAVMPILLPNLHVHKQHETSCFGELQLLLLQSLGMLTASSALQASQPHPPPSSTTPTFPARLAFFYAALYLLALAQGFHRPCAEALGVDQFAAGEPADRSSYFNWFHFNLAWGYAVAAAGVSYVEDDAGWAVGFATCWVSTVLSAIPHRLPARLANRISVRLLPREAEDGDGLVCVKLLPIWLASVVFALVISQVSTLFTKQGSTLDRRVGDTGLVVPPAALLSFISVSFVVLVPVYDRVVVPLARRLTGHHAGITALQRVGAGIAASCLAMAVAASRRPWRPGGSARRGTPAWRTRHVSTLFTKQGSTLDRRVGDTGLGVPPAALLSFISLSFVVLIPVYDRAVVLLARRVTGHHAGVTALQRVGAGIAASCVAMAVAAAVESRRLRVARDAGAAAADAPPGAALPMSLWWLAPHAMGIGSYASGTVVSAINWATKRGGESWFSDNLNRAHLDYFYWFLAGLAAVDVAVFFYFANRYTATGTKGSRGSILSISSGV